MNSAKNISSAYLTFQFLIWSVVVKHSLPAILTSLIHFNRSNYKAMQRMGKREVAEANFINMLFGVSELTVSDQERGLGITVERYMRD